MNSSYGSTPVAAHFDRSLVIAWAGPMAESILFTGRDQRERAAIHEAGHAVAGWRFGHGIADVVIRLDGSGETLFAPMGARTGALSSPRAYPAIQRPLSDVRRAVAVSRLLRSNRRAARELLRVRRFEARIFVNQHAGLIRAVAAKLLEVGKLTGVEAESIISATIEAARMQQINKLERNHEDSNASPPPQE